MTATRIATPIAMRAGCGTFLPAGFSCRGGDAGSCGGDAGSGSGADGSRGGDVGGASAVIAHLRRWRSGSRVAGTRPQLVGGLQLVGAPRGQMLAKSGRHRAAKIPST